MADTRSKAQMKEPTAREVEHVLGSRIQILEEKFAKKIDVIDKNVEEMIEATRKMLITKSDESSQARSTPLLATPTFNHNETKKMRNIVPYRYSGLAKIYFPKFNGENVREWLFKAEQFFSLDDTPEDLKVRLASFQFDGVALTWYRSKFSSSVIYDWNQYHQLLVERFELMDDPIAEWKQLRETDGIVKYQEKFELIMTRANFPKEYLVSAYLAGLRTDTQMHIRMFQPQSIEHCFFLGRLYEKVHPKNLKSTDMTATDDWEVNNLKKEEARVELSEEGDIAQTSANAVIGDYGYKRMIVKGKHGKHDLNILIGSGSAYNFIDKKIADKLGCQLQAAGATRVKVANGREIGVTAIVKDFKWYFQGVCFKADVIAIPLGGCDMMLGCQWLETLGPITWNFKKLQMTFSTGNLQLTLHGIGNEPMGKQVQLSALHCWEDDEDDVD